MEVDGSGIVHYLTWLTHIGGAKIQDNIWKAAKETEAKEIYHKTEIIQTKIQLGLKQGVYSWYYGSGRLYIYIY